MQTRWQRAKQILRARLRARELGAASPPLADAVPEAPSNAPGPRQSASEIDAEELEALRLLELAPGAGDSEIRSAYRRLCRRYHPDRFAGDARKEAVANDLIAQINRAYARLCQKRGGPAQA